MNYGILLSGGVGMRMDAKLPKQYVRLKDRMIITHSAASLFKSKHVDRIVFVMDEGFLDEVKRDLSDEGLSLSKFMGVAKPGFNRQDSIRQGMKRIEEMAGPFDKEDTVLIQDAARPFLTEEDLDQMYAALGGHDGVMPVLPMKDTVYLGDGNGRVDQLLPRERVYAGQAPELFMLEKYERSVAALSEEELARIHGSTEPAILYGMDIVMIDGDERNFKITTKEDMKRALSVVNAQ